MKGEQLSVLIYCPGVQIIPHFLKWISVMCEDGVKDKVLDWVVLFLIQGSSDAF